MCLMHLNHKQNFSIITNESRRRRFSMMNKNKIIALGAAIAVVSVGSFVGAQDDMTELTSLLEQLDAEAAPAAATPASAPVAEPTPMPVAEPTPVVVAEPAPTPVAEPTPVVVAEPAPTPVVVAEPTPTPVAEPTPVVASTPAANTDAELIDNIRATEELRRKARDKMAVSEVSLAREAMQNEEYADAISHYGAALKLFNDSAKSKGYRKECEINIAEALYRAAYQEYDLGRIDRAKELMEKAINRRHPKARSVLERWNAESEDKLADADSEEPSHVFNDAAYKADRDQVRKHLRRSRQYLAVRDMQHALEECELVLAVDNYNQDAIRLRKAIEKKRDLIHSQEHEQARDGMIADVEASWRPVYAVNAARFNEKSNETVKTQVGNDPELTVKQDIERRMKEMRLPTISFKPPATIVEAIDSFRAWSRDYDRPDIPIEKRGFNFVLKVEQGALKANPEDAAGEGFGSSGDELATANGLPPIPTIVASDISFYEALKLVCDSVDYKFYIKGQVIMVMPKGMSIGDMVARKYDVPEAFIERVNSAAGEIKEMRGSSSGGFGSSSSRRDDSGEESQERDWKEFFKQMGVTDWPEGSSITHIKTLGKLYVRNTEENLAQFEKVLEELDAQPPLIEVETRFVEVTQEDLNSLGFEWILNSDYSLNLGNTLGKALGISDGVWGSEGGSRSFSNTVRNNYTGQDNINSIYGGSGSSIVSDGKSTDVTDTQRSIVDSYNRSRVFNNRPGNADYDSNYWIRNRRGSERNIGINAFGGSSDYANGNRFLSTMGNHISGEAQSTNDQFMRVNAFLGEADLSLILHMLSQRSDTDLLSAPKVVTKSGEGAVMKVVTEYLYPTDYNVQLQSSSSGGGYGSSSQSAVLAVVEPQSFATREVGVILDVLPHYSESNGGIIDLELKPEVVDEPTWMNYGMEIPFTGNSSLQSFEGIGDIFTGLSSALGAIGAALDDATRNAMAIAATESATAALDNLTKSGDEKMSWYQAPMKQPFFHVRKIDTKVSLVPGATVVMGGLITEQRKAMDDKVPFLGDLPFIGRLFRSHAEQTVKRNLLIFVTARLISPTGRERKPSQDTFYGDTNVKPAPTAGEK